MTPQERLREDLWQAGMRQLKLEQLQRRLDPGVYSRHQQTCPMFPLNAKGGLAVCNCGW